MEVGCGGVGLRTSRGDVVNLYFWHLEERDGVRVRQEDFLGRADSTRVKRELLRRMAMYDRRVQQKLAARIAKLEGQLAHPAPRNPAPVAMIEERSAEATRFLVPAVSVGARGL